MSLCAPTPVREPYAAHLVGCAHRSLYVTTQAALRSKEVLRGASAAAWDSGTGAGPDSLALTMSAWGALTARSADACTEFWIRS